MAIEYRIDHERRTVFATGRGTLTDQEVFGYQRDVWSRADIAGYDEIMDMSDVQHIALPSSDRVRALASLSAKMDGGAPPSKFAIVAPDHLAFGLGRMYETYRELDVQSTKKVAVFRSMELALEWLGMGEADR